ncbi:MAG: ComEC/Rec2 family competence protein [Treponema sp.]|jgi:competence protein ComEC|nr:ComEC/Rec2 family competence protein [Treponema sp.]
MVSPLAAAALFAALGFYSRSFLSRAGPAAAALITTTLLGAALAAALPAALFLFRRPAKSGPAASSPRGLFSDKAARSRYGPFPGMAAASCCGLLAGLWAGAGLAPLSPGLPVEKIVSLSGTLLEDPRSFQKGTEDPEDRRGMAVLELKESGAVLPGTGTARASARGRVLVFFPGGTMPRLREFGRGAEIFVEGRFLDWEGNEDGQSGGKNAGASVPRFRAVSVHVVRGAPGPERLRTGVRGFVLEQLERKSWGGLAAALLLGTREDLDGDLALAYRDAGLSHILALSGMHLAFLSAMLAALFKKPFGKKGAAAAGLCFIVLYVFLVGPQPSLVRAAIMYVMGSCMVLAGKIRQPLTLLAAAFLLQLLRDPASAAAVSFILSYLALGGILVLTGSLETIVKKEVPPSLAGGLAASLGAFCATAPVVVLFFGILRPVGIAGGFLVVPLTGIFMALSLGALGCGNIPFLGGFLDHAPAFVEFLLGKIVAFFALAPGLRILPPAACIGFPLTGIAVLFLAGRTKRYRSYLAPFP